MLPDSEIVALGTRDEDATAADEKEVCANEKDVIGDEDGGLQAWLSVFATFMSNVATIGLSAAFGTFEEAYLSTILSDRTPSDVAWIGSIQTGLLLGTGLISGRLYDLGHLRPVLLLGSALLITGVFAQSVCRSYASLLLVQGVVQGLGMGLIFTPSWAAAFSWFSKRQGLAIGILASGSGIGGIIWSQMLSRLLQSSFGYKNTILVLGGCITACLSITLVFSRAKTFPAPEKRPLLDLRPLRDPGFALFVAGAFVNSLAIWLPWTYLPTFARLQGFDVDFSNTLLTAYNASAIVGRLAACSLGDVVGATNIFLAELLTCSALYISWFAATSRGPIIAWSVLTGFAAGADLASGPAAMVSLSRFRKHEYGLRGGLMFVAEGISAIAGPPIAGAILSRDGNDFLGVSLYSGAALIACFGFTLASRALFQRTTGLKRV